MGRSRAWTWTLNNYEETEEEKVKQIDSQYLVYGREVGEEGTPHLQGYVYFKTMKSLKQMKALIPRAHFEQSKGSAQQNRDYCVKDGDFFEQGVLPTGKKRSNASRKEMNQQLLETPIMELVENGDISVYSVPRLVKARQLISTMKTPVTTDGPKGRWIYGPPGTGKTHWARETYPDAYIKSQNKWWCGYEGQKQVILDDLDTAALGHYLKIWADKWPCHGETKGGKVQLLHEVFVVTSNYKPEDLWPEDSQMREAILRRFIFEARLIKYR